MDRFVNSLMGEVSGCPIPTIQAKVLASAIRFCQDSWIWTKKITASVSTGDETVTLVIPEKTVVAGVKEVRVNDRTFSAYTRNGVVITLDDVATGDFDLVATIALKPSRGATALDDTICEDWYEGIEAGAKELLMIMPGKPWYNPELAGAHNRHYLGKVHEAKIKVNQKNDTTQNRVRMRPFI